MSHLKNKTILFSIVLILFFSFVSTTEAKEIKNVTQLVMSEYVDPVVATRLNSETFLYKAEAGENLKNIAKKYNIEWDLVAAMNDIVDPNTVPEQVLVLPVIEDDEFGDEIYKVCSGDTLTSVAKEFNMSLEELISKNEIEEPDVLEVGQELIVSASVSQANAFYKRDVRPQTTRGVSVGLEWPLKGTITSPFGPRDSGFHHGLDIAAAAGTSVLAAENGKVIFSGWKNNIYGNTVTIEHNKELNTMYSHNSENIVEEGEYVKRGQPIAKAGSTGFSTGPHVHFGVYKNQKPVDPQKYLVPYQ